ncbi:MAG: response regulator transcription factor [Oscillospiraceae bacterium]|nr:response regulator transcription factor [Oscillospiraceae bacterium]
MIYIVEDDENIREMENYALRSSGYETVCCESGAELFLQLRAERAQMILLDLMLPGEDGLAILKRLRSETKTAQIPVIIVSAKAEELDRVRGLDGGADDYVTKPFGVMELLSRVRAVLRRTDRKPSGIRTLGGITLDEERREVCAGGERCSLTFKEHELLRTLMCNPGVALTRERLMDLVWGADFVGESRTVDMHIKSLRQKLGACGAQIKTIRSVGYKMEDA